jgi:L-2-hydroxyglutarate oxidase LhgO
VECGHLVNCAGLYADKLAHALGFAAGLALLPFKGLYLYCDIPLRTLVYPVPLLGAVFLGTHFTVTADGKTKIGPTAIPALWREQYGEDGLLAGFSAAEAAQIVGLEVKMMALRPELRALARVEVLKYAKSHMAAGAAELVHGASLDKFTKYGRAGIRAQLVHTATGALEMDYVVQGDAASTHVLNAVSPAWTCSRPFAELVVDGIGQRGSRAGESI